MCQKKMKEISEERKREYMQKDRSKGRRRGGGGGNNLELTRPD